MTFFSDNLLNNQYATPLNSAMYFNTRLDDIQEFQNSQTYINYIDAQNNQAYAKIKTKICDNILCKFNSIPYNVDLNNYELSCPVDIEPLTDEDKNDLMNVLTLKGYTCDVVNNILTIIP